MSSALRGRSHSWQSRLRCVGVPVYYSEWRRDAGEAENGRECCGMWQAWE